MAAIGEPGAGARLQKGTRAPIRAACGRPGRAASSSHRAWAPSHLLPGRPTTQARTRTRNGMLATAVAYARSSANGVAKGD